MTSSTCDIQLTPGQKCLLDVLQRKLLSTVQLYSKLSQERSQHLMIINKKNNSNANTNNNNNNQHQYQHIEELNSKLLLLKDRLRRLSAKQKRFTYEIISGNGNNTIPKESFFEALGLLTKEALIKINSKTKERRRRTTANPRFSHEAIQARRIVNSRQKSTAQSAKTTQSQNNTNNTTQNNTTANANNTSTTASNNNNNTRHPPPPSSQAASNKNNNNHNHQVVIPEELRTTRNELLQRFNMLQREINAKTNQIKDKRQSNEKIAHQNESIRNDMMNLFNSQIQWRCDESLEGLD